ncbi:hypothetical protein [Streptomyces sp. NPDC056013]|uniref:hypothetical protein n=1 Tax=Streptomyces sp. NPDC056013 TaxID=3345680 RepID=UPI0035DD9C55
MPPDLRTVDAVFRAVGVLRRFRTSTARRADPYGLNDAGRIRSPARGAGPVTAGGAAVAR